MRWIDITFEDDPAPVNIVLGPIVNLIFDSDQTANLEFGNMVPRIKPEDPIDPPEQD